MENLIEFPVEYNGEKLTYNAELVTLGMGDNTKTELKVSINGAEIYFNIDKDKELRASIISSSKNDPNFKRVRALQKSLIDAVLKSLEVRLISMAENPLLPKQTTKVIQNQGMNP